jgi:hypothetical protein
MVKNIYRLILVISAFMAGTGYAMPDGGSTGHLSFGDAIDDGIELERSFRCEWCGQHYPDGHSLASHWNDCLDQNPEPSLGLPVPPMPAVPVLPTPDAQDVLVEGVFDADAFGASIGQDQTRFNQFGDADSWLTPSNSQVPSNNPPAQQQAPADLPKAASKRRRAESAPGAGSEVSDGPIAGRVKAAAQRASKKICLAEDLDGQDEGDEEYEDEGDGVEDVGDEKYGKEGVSRERWFTCQYCPARFNHKSNRNRHKLTHTGKKPYVCDVCKKAFARSDDCANHARRCNPEARAAKALGRQQEMQEKIARREIGYACDGGEKSFTTHIGLFQHKRHCDREREAQAAEALARHQAKLAVQQDNAVQAGAANEEQEDGGSITQTARDSGASREKRFACGYCAARFAQQSHLTEHVHVHKGERPYLCNDCDRSFTRRSDLTRHKGTCARQRERAQAVQTEKARLRAQAEQDNAARRQQAEQDNAARRQQAEQDNAARRQQVAQIQAAYAAQFQAALVAQRQQAAQNKVRSEEARQQAALNQALQYQALYATQSQALQVAQMHAAYAAQVQAVLAAQEQEIQAAEAQAAQYQALMQHPNLANAYLGSLLSAQFQPVQPQLVQPQMGQQPQSAQNVEEWAFMMGAQMAQAQAAQAQRHQAVPYQAAHYPANMQQYPGAPSLPFCSPAAQADDTNAEGDSHA